jgi:polyphenol oxidase
MCMMNVPQPTGTFRWTQVSWGDALECEPLARLAPHVFTTRGLDLAAGPNGARGGWDQVALVLGATAGVWRVRQVHGASVAVIRRGAPRPVRQAAFADADAIVSDDPEVAVAAQVADCVPLLLADARRGTVAAVHAGWRGTVQGIVRRAVEQLTRTFGTAPEDLVAAIGPSIGPCCYQVGPEVRDAFRGAGHDAADLDRWFSPDVADRLRLDVWRANMDQLLAAGVPAGAVYRAELCTASYPQAFFSYRIEGPRAGRMAGAIRAPTR